MTRPRVSPDKRQRTAQACDSCKRRKQKCNGLQPCNTCSKRSLTCTFGIAASDHGSDSQSPTTKRQLLDFAKSPQEINSPHSSLHSPSATLQPFPPMKLAAENGVQKSSAISSLPPLQLSQGSPTVPPSDKPVQLISKCPPPSARPNVTQSSVQRLTVSEKPFDLVSGDIDSKDGSTLDDEQVAYVPNDSYSYRMLQDPTGRLQYVGDSATLSYLQLIRMLIENVSGPSSFTTDPNRHRIVEHIITLPPNLRNTHLLPDRATASVLVDAFFTNTSGFVHVVNRRTFMITLENCYSDPLHVDTSWLCLLNLVFAIGLILATPIPGTNDDEIIKKLRADRSDRAEMFYASAKVLCDPTTGFEDADFWSVQALLLMTIYTLTTSKRNAAYAYCGMAIRSGFALGLHRPDTLRIFDEEKRTVRTNCWRSLYILDTFLAASLGRPTSISNEDCSPEAFKVDPSPFSTPFNSTSTNNASHVGVDASVRSCQIIGTILKDVYSKRKITTKLAQVIADQCKPWPKTLDSTLHWQMIQITNINASHGIAIIHVNLLYCHTVILLTRPFFLHMFNKRIDERSRKGARLHRFGTRMEKFSESCILAACHSIGLVQSAMDGNYLSPRNPFVLYFLFASALIVLSNEFAALYSTPRATPSILSSIQIMKYCASIDPLAKRLVFILETFHDVVKRQTQVNQPEQNHARLVASNSDDPILNFFTSGRAFEVSTEISSFSHSNTTDRSSNAISIASLISNKQNQSPTSTSSTAHRQGSLDGVDSLEGEIEFESWWSSQSEGKGHFRGQGIADEIPGSRGGNGMSGETGLIGMYQRQNVANRPEPCLEPSNSNFGSA